MEYDGQGRPEETRIGDWIATQNGRFWPADPRPEELDVDDIALALSNLCRFNGHIREFYSVAQHSVLVAGLLPNELKLWGLLHDAAEAYVGDLPRPVKAILRQGGVPYTAAWMTYDHMENRILRVVAERFGLAWPMPDEVKKADAIALCTEARDFFGPHTLDEWAWGPEIEPLNWTLNPVGPSKARELWLRSYSSLTGQEVQE